MRFSLDKGDLLLVAGKSGSGKTTLVRAITNSIERAGGYLRGSVKIEGRDVRSLSPEEFMSNIAYIPQEPWYGLIGHTVWAELCYAESLLGKVCDKKRLEDFSLKGLERHITYGLSAGQLQSVLWAEAFSAGAKLIVMDEPLVYLDEDRKAAARRAVEKAISEGAGVVVVDHMLENWKDFEPQLLLLEGGRAQYYGPYAEGLARPDGVVPSFASAGKGVAAEAIDVWFKYPGYPWVLRGVHLVAEWASVVAIQGPNGSGKTTLLKLLAKLLRPRRGKVVLRGRPIYIPENPLTYFTMPTLFDELLYASRGREKAVYDAAEIFGLERVLGARLARLSTGERRRAAIASALLAGFDIYLLDEPTGGLDYYSAQRVAEAIKRLEEMGKAVVVAAHDQRLVRSAQIKYVLKGGALTRA